MLTFEDMPTDPTHADDEPKDDDKTIRCPGQHVGVGNAIDC